MVVQPMPLSTGYSRLFVCTATRDQLHEMMCHFLESAYRYMYYMYMYYMYLRYVVVSALLLHYYANHRHSCS